MCLAAFLIPHFSFIVPRVLTSHRRHMSNIPRLSPPSEVLHFTGFLCVPAPRWLGSMLAMIEIFISAVDLWEHAKPPWQIASDM